MITVKYDVPDDLPELGPNLVATLSGLKMSLFKSGCLVFCKCILKCSHTACHHNQNCGKNHTHLDVNDLPHGCVALRTVWSAGVDWTQRSAGLAPLQEERALSGALLTWQSPEKNLAESRKGRRALLWSGTSPWQSPESFSHCLSGALLTCQNPFSLKCQAKSHP